MKKILKSAIAKRVLSAGLVITLVITMIHVIPRDNSMDVTYAAWDNSTRVRGVVDFLDDLPQYNNTQYLAERRGTAHHPFVVLEIVPFEEYAEFGYLISGCEPVDIDKMRGSYTLMYQVESIKSITLGQANGQFHFMGYEPEITDPTYRYDKTPTPVNNYTGTIDGYYEYVGTGGTLRYEFKNDEENDQNETVTTDDASGDIIVEAPSPEDQDNAVNDVIDENITDVSQDANSENVQDSVESGNEPETSPSDDATGPSESTKESDTEENTSEVDREEMAEIAYRYSGRLEKTSEVDGTMSQVGKTNEETSQDGETQEETSQGGETQEETSQGGETQEEIFQSGDQEETSQGGESQEETSQDGNGDEEIPSFKTMDEIEGIALISVETDRNWKIVPVSDGSGTLIWHTVTPAEKAKLEKSGNIFITNLSELSESDLPKKVGARLYASRQPEEGEVVYEVDCFFDYTHNEVFLTRSMVLTPEQADDFSIVVKTITFDQLNEGPAALEWIDYADLIFMRPKTDNTAVPKLWINGVRRLEGHNPTNPDYNETVENFDNIYGENNNKKYFDDPEHDLSWDAALRIYNKATADNNNFAALVMDDGFFTTTVLNASKKDSVPITVYNWSLEKAKNLYGYDYQYQNPAYNSNIYKLYVMMTCMDSNLFKQIYLSGNEPIVKNGVNRLQPENSDSRTYWCPETFMLAPDGLNTDLQYFWRSNYWDMYHYWTTDQTTTNKSAVLNHFYYYSGDTSMSQTFVTSQTPWKDDYYKSRFPDFIDALDDFLDNPNDATPAEALRYILGNFSDSNYYGKGQTLKVLDLEPSIGLKGDGTPNGFLKKTYVNMLLPHFQGDIEIVHQTTAEFIGKIEDLNATYDLIYMGLDCSGYNTKKWDFGNGLYYELPDWNDDALDKKIYLRTGDYMLSTEREGSVKWLLNLNKYNSSKVVERIENTRMRFPGNDISRIKWGELEDYLNAFYPIVADQLLYDLDPIRIDSNSYVYKFIDSMKSQQKNGKPVPLFGTKEINSGIELAARNALAQAVTIKFADKYRYDGTTDDTIDESGKIIEISADIKNLKYLDTKTVEGKVRACLPFEITTGTDGYLCKVYVDLNRDSKFTRDEIQVLYMDINQDGKYSSDEVKNNKDGVALKQGTTPVDVLLPEGWVGFLQWKVEVCLASSPSIRYVETGCSAVQPDYKNGVDTKKQVKVLQIMPNDLNTAGALNLEKNDLFRKYYKDLEDYKITITSITYDEYVSYFYYTEDGKEISWGFEYDYTKEDTDDAPNPVNLDKLHNSKYPDLMSYNMIIVGFGDFCGFGTLNINNIYGQIDFLRYFADQGKSILFTHDLTTFYNDNYKDYSFSVNATMRDLMGMNRYGSVNYHLNDEALINNNFMHNDELRRMLDYQKENSSKYDHVSIEEIHGYTYYAMKRMGYHNENSSNANLVAKNKVPYRYMITNPLNKSIGMGNLDGKETGFNGDYDYTTEATKVNEGQITVYPYKIGDTLPISTTHGQYYQLSPEDPNLTVWYCLSGDGSMMNTRANRQLWKPVEGTKDQYHLADMLESDMYDGSSITYAVSPNDTMNNYYIYSKGNIFYSGVGHSTVKSDMEAKLFVNTMIAAYSAGYEPPLVEVTNKEAVSTGTLQYSIEIMQNYELNEDGNMEGDDFKENDIYKVTFIPQDFNLATDTKLNCVIQLENGDYIKKVKNLTGITKDDGTIIPAGTTFSAQWINGEMCFTDLVRGIEYSFDYNKDYLSNYDWEIKETQDDKEVVVASGHSVNKITFTINNNKIKTPSITRLDISALPLFPLD